jgi:hypothetical protein
MTTRVTACKANSLSFIETPDVETTTVMNHLRLCCIAAVLALLGQSAAAQKVGTTSMQFLKVMPTARGTAMGEAYTTLATGAEAVFWNPGGVAILHRPEFSLTYIDWIFDTRQGALSSALSLGDWGAVGLQLQYVDYGVFDEALANPARLTGQQFHPFTYLIGLTYARKLTDRFSAGLTAKFAHESLFSENSVVRTSADGLSEAVNTYTNGVLFDFGLVYDTGYRSLKIAASIQNFGASLKYARESSPAPMLFRLGIGGDLIGADGLLGAREDHRVSAAFDLFQPNDYTQQVHAGLEYEYAGTFAVRAGYKFNYDFEGFTIGAGFRQEIADLLLSFDYSFGSLGTYLGKVHRISLGAGL